MMNKNFGLYLLSTIHDSFCVYTINNNNNEFQQTGFKPATVMQKFDILVRSATWLYCVVGDLFNNYSLKYMYNRFKSYLRV